MAIHRSPILIETWRGRIPADSFAPATAQPAEVALALREKGWVPYRVQFDAKTAAWIANVIDWGKFERSEEPEKVLSPSVSKRRHRQRSLI